MIGVFCLATKHTNFFHEVHWDIRFVLLVSCLCVLSGKISTHGPLRSQYPTALFLKYISAPSA